MIQSMRMVPSCVYKDCIERPLDGRAYCAKHKPAESPVKEPNYWTLPIPELSAMLARLKHAGVRETVTDSDGSIIREATHHYAGCTRCIIEDIIRQRSDPRWQNRA